MRDVVKTTVSWKESLFKPGELPSYLKKKKKDKKLLETCDKFQV